jgi:hypothetical protein
LIERELRYYAHGTAEYISDTNAVMEEPDRLGSSGYDIASSTLLSANTRSQRIYSFAHVSCKLEAMIDHHSNRLGRR